MLRTIRERLRRGIVTEGRAESQPAPPLFRGMPVLDPDRCTGDGACAAVCPTAAISFRRESEDAGWTWRLDRARCVGCGLCVDVCPSGALTIDPSFELAVRNREDLVTEMRFVAAESPLLAERQRDDGTAGASAAADDLRRRAADIFRSSLHVRHVDVGSSNAEDWELNALLNPIYDLQRFGIDFVASPRHADMLVVTGAVTRNLAPALIETYAATPEPKLVVAVGTEACSGGIGAGSYAVVGPVDRLIPVDVYIPGDPPRPQAILHGILLALDRREQKQRSETRVEPIRLR